MQKPTIGRIVEYVLGPYDSFVNNGSDRCPAVIVRVWSDTTVNLRLLTDSNETPWVTSRCLADEPDQKGRWQWPVKA